MEEAKIKIQTIYVDISKKESILPENSFYVTNYETILFDGFLVLYNNYESDNENGLIEIKKNDIFSFDNVKVSEEYTKPPLRYNESN